MNFELILLSAIAHYEEALRSANNQTDILVARSMAGMAFEKIQEFESKSLLPLARDGVLLSDALGKELG